MPKGHLLEGGGLQEGGALQKAARAWPDSYQAAVCPVKVCTHLPRQDMAWLQCDLPPPNPGRIVATVRCTKRTPLAQRGTVATQPVTSPIT